MNESLSHRAVIITGAARGLGAAMAFGLAKAGARMSLTDVDIGELLRTRDQIYAETGNDAIAVFEADAARYGDAHEVVASTIARHGAVDIIINNAGLGLASIRPDFISHPVRFWEVDPTTWARMLAVNVNGPFYLEHAAVPGMIKRGWGRVINVTTTFQTMLSFDIYGPAKAALEAHSYISAKALEDTGVTVNVLIPGGPADTAQVTDDIGAPRSALLPPAVMVQPLLWLCSSNANGITGRRFSAAAWDASVAEPDAAAKASRSIAWPELVMPIILPNRASLSSEL